MNGSRHWASIAATIKKETTKRERTWHYMPSDKRTPHPTASFQNWWLICRIFKRETYWTIPWLYKKQNPNVGHCNSKR